MKNRTYGFMTEKGFKQVKARDFNLAMKKMKGIVWFYAIKLINHKGEIASAEDWGKKNYIMEPWRWKYIA